MRFHPDTGRKLGKFLEIPVSAVGDAMENDFSADAGEQQCGERLRCRHGAFPLILQTTLEGGHTFMLVEGVFHAYTNSETSRWSLRRG